MMKESLEKLKAKGEIYRLLSRAYHTPDIDFIKNDFPDATRKALHVLNSELCDEKWADTLNDLHDKCEPMELALEYTRLFRGPVKAEVYPYESMHIDGEAFGASALDVVSRYRVAGVSLAEGFKDLPDHISAELEFMHYLCGKELKARQEGISNEADCFYDWRQGFLKNHLSRWVPRFTDLVLEHTTTSYYLVLARITREFIEQETKGVSEGRSVLGAR